MSEKLFYCPVCEQRIQGEYSYAGAEYEDGKDQEREEILEMLRRKADNANDGRGSEELWTLVHEIEARGKPGVKE